MDEITPTPFANSESSCTVMVIEDNLVMRNLLRDIIDSIDHTTWFGGFGTLAEARRALSFRSRFPDLILLDLVLPDGSGIEVLQSAHVKTGRSRVAFATGREDDNALSCCLNMRLAGYIDKVTSRLRDWKIAIKNLSLGGSYYSPSVMPRLQKLRQSSDHWTLVLTCRERELAPLMARGQSNQQLADRFSLSPQTVQVHRKRIMHKLDVHSTPELMERARKMGLGV